MDLLSLPVVMVENIFSYLSYDEIAKNRLVSKAFNEICMRMLNRGFLMIERRHTLALKNVKAQLPRRESERRYHPLSRHSDILTSIETRISMLNMTYSKFIDNGLCCFIPGKVIDEIKRVLTIVETSATPPRAHEVLQELRDISSMAIEHFDDKISPEFRRRMQEGAVQTVRPAHPGVLAPLVIRQEMLHLRKRSALNVKLSLYLATRYKKFYGRMMDYKKLAMKQQRAIRQLTRKQKLQDTAITELKRRVEDLDIKYTELSLSVGGKSMEEVTPAPAQPLRHFSSQIKLDLSVLPIGTSNRNHNKLTPNMKPRKPVIKLPSLSEGDDEPPPKIQKIDDKQDAPTTSKSPFTVNMRDLAMELRQLNTITKSFENNLKRTMGFRSDSTPDCKKQKID